MVYMMGRVRAWLNKKDRIMDKETILSVVSGIKNRILRSVKQRVVLPYERQQIKRWANQNKYPLILKKLSHKDVHHDASLVPAHQPLCLLVVDDLIEGLIHSDGHLFEMKTRAFKAAIEKKISPLNILQVASITEMTLLCLEVLIRTFKEPLPPDHAAKKDKFQDARLGFISNLFGILFEHYQAFEKTIPETLKKVFLERNKEQESLLESTVSPPSKAALQGPAKGKIRWPAADSLDSLRDLERTFKVLVKMGSMFSDHEQEKYLFPLWKNSTEAFLSDLRREARAPAHWPMIIDVIQEQRELEQALKVVSATNVKMQSNLEGESSDPSRGPLEKPQENLAELRTSSHLRGDKQKRDHQDASYAPHEVESLNHHDVNDLSSLSSAECSSAVESVKRPRVRL